MINEIHNENCLETMGKMKDCFIDLVVTSPPYDKLRKYEGYTFDFKPIAKELYRVVKIGGCVVWVVGDATVRGSETGTSFKQALYFKEIGFCLHDTMIWHKKSPMPTQHTRYENSFEYMFVFSKSKPNVTNILREESKTVGRKRIKHRAQSGLKDSLNDDGEYITKKDKIRHNVWNISINTTRGLKHTAPFPEQLVNDHILSWSNEGDLIYDPFMGSGTTAIVAKLNNRNYIGSEISEEYTRLAKERIGEKMPRKKLEMGNANFEFLPEVPEGRTLDDAQEDIKDALEEGDSISCPCCGRFVKAYAKKLSATMVTYLIELVAAYIHSRDWVDVGTLPSYQIEKQLVNYAVLRNWGLLTAKENEKTLFKPSKDGYDFIRGIIEVPTHCFQFNGEIFGYSATMIEVRGALGDKFDYDELMKAVPIPKKKIKKVVNDEQ